MLGVSSFQLSSDFLRHQAELNLDFVMSNFCFETNTAKLNTLCGYRAEDFKSPYENKFS